MGLSEYQKLRQQWNQTGKPPKEKKVYSIPKKSEKKKAQEKAEREARGDDDTDLQKWFRARQKQMTGHCNECGAKTETKLYQYAIHSICHILAKREEKCPSVAYNPFNWVELCPDHHHKFDNSSWEEIEKWGIWPEIQDRLILIYPDLDPKERRHFPQSVLKEIEKRTKN